MLKGIVENEVNEMEVMVSKGFEEVLSMKTIDIGRTTEAQKLWDKYAKLYNSLMEAAEEVGLDYKLIKNTINAIKEYDQYDKEVRLKLVNTL